MALAQHLYGNGSSPEEPLSDVVETDVLFLIYTSGTEAFPKAVMIPHRNYPISTVPAWAMGAPADDDELAGGIVRTYDRWLFLTPLHTIAGLGNFTIVLSLGASIIMPRLVDVGTAISLTERERVTAMVQTPTFFLGATQHPRLRRQRSLVGRAPAHVRRHDAALDVRGVGGQEPAGEVVDVLGSVRAHPARHDGVVPLDQRGSGRGHVVDRASRAAARDPTRRRRRHRRRRRRGMVSVAVGHGRLLQGPGAHGSDAGRRMVAHRRHHATGRERSSCSSSIAART